MGIYISRREGKENPYLVITPGIDGGHGKGQGTRIGTARWPRLALVVPWAARRIHNPKHTRDIIVRLLLTTMSASPDDDYDKLSPEEREIRDKADRQREAEEQAGMAVILVPTFIYLNYLKALPYSWTQALQDVDIVVPVPKGTRGRDLLVVIAKMKLSVGLKGKDPIMAGDLCHEIKVEDSTWTLG